MRVTALAGGVGGAKLLQGLQRALPPGELTAVVNTGDDARMYGLHVSPDVDIVTYWLAEKADTERGWGIAGDTFRVVEALGELGAENWFRLGDTDLATCLFRTMRMSAGISLSATTEEVRTALGIPTRILPVSDDPVHTTLHCADGRVLEFQEYFVRERTEPEVVAVTYRGAGAASAAPGVVDALRDCDVLILCPSNPILSIGPILAVAGIRDLLRDHPCVVAVSPIVAGSALKGPADRLLRDLGHEASAAAVAALYRDFCTVFVLDRVDAELAPEVEATGCQTAVIDTVMTDVEVSERLARAIMSL